MTPPPRTIAVVICPSRCSRTGFQGTETRAEQVTDCRDVGLIHTTVSKDAGRKVFLILDNLGVHHCKPVKAWLATRTAQMAVFYLPSYSPELNPEERLNADLKHVIGRKAPIRTNTTLRAAAENHMKVVASEPARVKYAA